MKLLCWAIAGVLLFLLSTTAFADLPTNTVNKQFIEQHQRALLDNAQQQRRSLISSSRSSLVRPALDSDSLAPCETIQHFIWKNTGEIDVSGALRKKWVAPYRGQCLSIQRMHQLSDSATNDLIGRGLVTTRVILPPTLEEKAYIQMQRGLTSGHIIKHGSYKKSMVKGEKRETYTSGNRTVVTETMGKR